MFTREPQPRTPTATAPRFRINMPVKLDGYTGLLYADADEPARYVVTGIRLLPDRPGWEYLVALADRRWAEWGWVREADLMAVGYQPEGQA
jgi:hypothetical protein